jgi:ADP-ribose pyrophosphatase YjhB (NUDIX family)
MSSSRTPKDLSLYPLVSVDIALFSLVESALKVLLVRRANTPEQGRWALPGGVLDPERDGTLEDTALRVLHEKTGLDAIPLLTQVHTFSGRDRDPRGWSLSVLFYALLPLDKVPARAKTKVEEVEWRVAARPGRSLAFDHADHVALALSRLRDRVGQRALPLHLLPGQFTLTQLQRAIEQITETELEKSAFRRRLKDDTSIVPVEGAFQVGVQRPAQLFEAAEGFEFEKPLAQ